jgi:hypothetical protein
MFVYAVDLTGYTDRVRSSAILSPACNSALAFSPSVDRPDFCYTASDAAVAFFFALLRKNRKVDITAMMKSNGMTCDSGPQQTKRITVSPFLLPAIKVNNQR